MRGSLAACDPAALGTTAVLIKQEFLLVLAGGLFVLEAASVILQVASFRLTGRRVRRLPFARLAPAGTRTA